MIKDRPATLLDDPAYRCLPTTPFSADFQLLPELVRMSLGSLGGIQPVTGAMAQAANGALYDRPSAGEAQLFRTRGTKFQLISVVLNLASMRAVNGVSHGTPYSVSLIPASKRGAVEEKSIDFVERINIDTILDEREPCYMGYDPFSGDWSLFGPLAPLINGNHGTGFVDELGLVVQQYFLATEYDPADVLTMPAYFTDPRTEKKYNRHREKLLYTPFTKVQARRVWGSESPIELFLFQELIRRGLSPILQVLFCNDGSFHSSLYHLWRDIEFRHAPDLITEADMFFPEQRVAVFCDSTRHHRGRKAQVKDQAISDRLATIGIEAVRLPGAAIVRNLKAAGDKVCRALRA